MYFSVWTWNVNKVVIRYVRSGYQIKTLSLEQPVHHKCENVNQCDAEWKLFWYKNMLWTVALLVVHEAIQEQSTNPVYP